MSFCFIMNTIINFIVIIYIIIVNFIMIIIIVTIIIIADIIILGESDRMVVFRLGKMTGVKGPGNDQGQGSRY